MIKSLVSREASGELAAAAKSNALPNMERQRLAASTNYLTLELGSDVEISRRLWDRLNEIYGRVVYSEGHIWYYGRTHWQPFPEHELRRLVQEFDGARYPTPSGSLAWLLGGVFKGDPDSSEKAQLLAEICGVAAVGHATKLLQPRAVVLHGSSAENGKGQILDLMRGLLPELAVCSVAPAVFNGIPAGIAMRRRWGTWMITPCFAEGNNAPSNSKKTAGKRGPGAGGTALSPERNSVFLYYRNSS